jgi:hypothetical protein
MTLGDGVARIELGTTRRPLIRLPKAGGAWPRRAAWAALLIARSWMSLQPGPVSRRRLQPAWKTTPGKPGGRGHAQELVTLQLFAQSAQASQHDSSGLAAQIDPLL